MSMLNAAKLALRIINLEKKLQREELSPDVKWQLVNAIEELKAEMIKEEQSD